MIAFLARTRGLALAAVLVAALSLLTAVREGLAPHADRALVSRAAHRALINAAPERNGGTPLLVVGYREPSLIFVEGTDTVLRQGPDAAALAQVGQLALVSGVEEVRFQKELQSRNMHFARMGAPIRGRNYSNGDWVYLQPGRITDARR